MCVCWQHTLETALLSASQELREQSGYSTSSSTCTSSTLVQQKEVLQSGLLSTCRELSRVNAVSRNTTHHHHHHHLYHHYHHSVI